MALYLIPYLSDFDPLKMLFNGRQECNSLEIYDPILYPVQKEIKAADEQT